MDRITYIGHATLLLEAGSVRLLTDPLLAKRVSHLWRAVALPVLRPARPDAVLISHLHGDHLHLPSLRLLGNDIRLITPAGAAVFLARNGFHQVTELVAGQTTEVSGVTVEATTAAHEGRSVPGRPEVDALGYIIHSDRPTYFAGDTDLFPEMAAIGGRIDIALLPVWGYGPTLGPGHLDPQRAAEALRLLRPKLAIPIHWGTYFPIGLRTIMPRYLQFPAQQFAEHARALAPDVRTVILEPGSGIDLDAL